MKKNGINEKRDGRCKDELWSVDTPCSQSEIKHGVSVSIRSLLTFQIIVFYGHRTLYYRLVNSIQALFKFPWLCPAGLIGTEHRGKIPVASTNPPKTSA